MAVISPRFSCIHASVMHLSMDCLFVSLVTLDLDQRPLWIDLCVSSPTLIPHNHFPLQHSSLTTNISFIAIFHYFFFNNVDSPIYVRFLHCFIKRSYSLSHLTDITLYCVTLGVFHSRMLYCSSLTAGFPQQSLVEGAGESRL